MRILHSRAFSSPAHVLTPVLSLLAMCALADAAFAQVRMKMRNDMQISGMGSFFWPIQTNWFEPGDVDGDGDLDLLAALNSGVGRLWLNDGRGGFTRFADLTGALGLQSATCCVLFDADGDGDLDALFGGGGTAYGSPSLSNLFLNDGTGSFTLSPTIPSHPVNDRVQTAGIGVGDCDGDGDRDVVLFASWSGSLRYLRNDGAATFTNQTATAFPAGVFAGGGMLADVEPDGDLDVVMGVLHRNNGLGVFTTEPGIPWQYPLTGHRAMADVDGDTLLDEVGVKWHGTTYPTNVPYVRRNLGGGVFQDVSSTWFEPHALVDRTAPFDDPYHAVAVFDADGDGDPDLVTAGALGRTTVSTTVGIPPKVFLNSNRQRFVDASQPALPCLMRVARAVAVGDIDGDADVDLVLGHGWPTDAVWKQDAAGRFHGFSALPFPTVSVPSWGAFELADVDGDTDLDLIGVSGSLYFGGGVQHRLALNNGSGTFTDVTATHMPVIASLGLSCASGDIDGDGDVDVVIGSYTYTGAPLILLRNSGAGVFANASAQLPSTPCNGWAVALRDFDSDGDRDLVASVSGGYPIRFFANDGTGNFTDETASRVPALPGGGNMSVTDLDGDGDLDIAAGSGDLRNNGAGVFTATTVPYARTHVLDLDEDGVPDALTVGTSVAVVGGPAIWWDYGGGGHFVLPVDLDRDADIDLIVCPIEPYTQWDILRIELLYNLRRDLRVATLPRIGADYILQLRATNGTAGTYAIVAAATATLPQAVEIPGWGTLQIDPTQMAVLGIPLIPDADTMVEVSMPIPATPSLFGLPLSCQALFVPVGNPAATHLSNAMTFLLER